MTELSDSIRTVIRLARIAQQACDEVGLTLPQYRALNAIVRGPQRAFELARYSAVSRPAMSALTTGLEKQGWIERRTATEDGRGVAFVATDTGRERFQAAEHRLSEHFAAVLGDATEALLGLDTATIEDALDRQVERDFPATTTAEAR
ncbi:MAG: MarR family transcriptional regulator [Acidimicrobiales bacterium]